MGRQGIVKEILMKSTDFLRRVIAPIGGMGGVTLSYVRPYEWRAPNRILVVQLGVNANEAKVFKLLANQQTDGDSPILSIVTGLHERSRKGIMDGLRSFTERDNHSGVDVNHLRRDIRSFYVQRPNCSGDYPEAAIREGADELTLRAEGASILTTLRKTGQQTVWESLMEMERFQYRAGEEQLGAVALVLDLARAFERVSIAVVWAWATHISSPRKMLRVLCGNFEHQRRMQFEGCVAEPLRTITAILPGSKWSCLLLRSML